MAETSKSVADLKTLLADNTSGAISAQDLRDFLVSALGVYGSISVFKASTQQDNVGTSGVLLTCFTTNGNSNGTTPDQANDRITVGVAGDYDIGFQACFVGTNGAVIEFRLRVNGTEQNFGVSRVASTSAYGSASFLANVTLAANDIVTVYVNSDGATDDITVSEAQLTLRMVG